MPRSLRGHMLIAGRRLRDTNFFRSVVLMVEHNAEGAMGVVLNQPTEITVSSALESVAEMPETGELVYLGGPVERQALFIIHNAADLQSDNNEILDGVYLGAGPDDFETIVRRVALGESPLRYRMFFGCAGWGPRQLEGELKRNDWMVLPARSEHIFPEDPYTLWDDVAAEYQKLHPPVKGIPTDPRWN
ncbi:MAG: YqgE/AlgH family protein [Planctomycetota bacterium]|nr:YqgE/AlgH family protein [Planctomycetota bacterium]